MVTFKIADISCGVRSAVALEHFADFNQYKPFLFRPRRSPESIIKIDCKNAPEITVQKRVFVPDTRWDISKTIGGYVLRLGVSRGKRRQESTAIFKKQYHQVSLYHQPAASMFRGYIDQFLFRALLSRHNGFLLHAAGIQCQGKGVCFTGRSGAGKSTITKLFLPRLSPKEVFNDDRVAIRYVKKEWWVYGTPWHGEIPMYSSGCARLSTLFILRQAKRTYTRRLSVPEVLPELLRFIFLPFWDTELMEKALETVARFVQEVAIFELGFLPDESAVEKVLEVVNGKVESK